MRLKFLTGGICLVAVLLATTGRTQEEPLTFEELYTVCSRFPFNSRCEGIEFGAALKDAPGTRVGCSLRLNDIPTSGQCRLDLKDTELTVYAELSEELEFVTDDVQTVKVNIPLDGVFNVDLRIWQAGSDGVTVAIGGTLYILRDAEEYTRFGEYDPATDTDERGGFGDADFAEVEIGFVTESPAKLGNRSNILQITASEEYGAFLRDRLSAVADNAAIAQFREQLQTPAGSDMGKDEGDRAKQLEQLLETKTCMGCDLRGVDLSGKTLNGANLEGANLQGANLSGAKMEGSYFIGTDFSGANLTGADLSGSRFTLASFQGAIAEGIDLDVASVQLTNLQDAKLANARLGGTNLEGAILTNADLTGADLSDFISTDYLPFLGLNRYRLYTNLHSADLTGANLTSANLEDAKVKYATLVGTTLAGANLNDVNFYSSDLTGADLTNTNMDEAKVENAIFKEANLTGADLDKVDLTSANLCNATMPDGSVSNQGC